MAEDEPALKRPRTENGGPAREAGPPTATTTEPEPPKELEQDAPVDKKPKIQEPVVFRTGDTTVNIMPSSFGSMLTTLTDGGMQYLLAGARACVGIQGGRYLFEAKVVEMLSLEEQGPKATSASRWEVRLGYTLAGSSLFVGEGSCGIGFDQDGNLLYDRKKTMVGQRSIVGAGDVLGVLLNLDKTSANANTISLFRNGERACPPQALPESLIGKMLIPTLSFKNITVHYNFGPVPLAPLPFRCRMVAEAAERDCVVTPAPRSSKDGRPEALFPVAVPDEGGFDWLDWFLEHNPHYIEISDRAIMRWADQSGLPRWNKIIFSQDKPELGFGISAFEDGSLRKMMQAVMPIQQRSCVVMEIKGNLLKEDRAELLNRWPSNYRRTAVVVVGEPPLGIKKRAQELALRQKQEAADAEFTAKKAEEKQTKLLEKRQRELDRERRKALKVQKKLQEQSGQGQGQSMEVEVISEADPETKEDASEEEPAEEESEVEVVEQPPRVELTSEEKKIWFRKESTPDLAPIVLSTAFTKFSLPENDEGFDEIRFDWQKAEKSRDRLKSWVQGRKHTARVEDLEPSGWFTSQYQDWLKILQSWHNRHNQYKADLIKRAADADARQKLRAAKKAARAAQNNGSEGKEAGGEAGAAVGDASGIESGGAEGSTGPAQGRAEEPEDGEQGGEEEEAIKAAEREFEQLDVFTVKDVLDVGSGQPLFAKFTFEDWTMLSLRFELHLLAYAFKRDVNDPDISGIYADHLMFYYAKYFKRPLHCKFFGVDSPQELIDYIRDTLVVNRKNQIIETQLPDDMESPAIFIMLTEESRRDRMRRVDLGQESARLRLQSQASAATSQGPGAGAGLVVRPPAKAAAGPMLPGAVSGIDPALAKNAGAGPDWQPAPPPPAMQQQADWQQRPPQMPQQNTMWQAQESWVSKSSGPWQQSRPPFHQFAKSAAWRMPKASNW